MHCARITICCVLASPLSVFAGGAVPTKTAVTPALTGLVKRNVSAGSPERPATQSESKDEKAVSILRDPAPKAESVSSKKNVLDLPNPLIAHAMSFLSPADHASAQANRVFYAAGLLLQSMPTFKPIRLETASEVKEFENLLHRLRRWNTTESKSNLMGTGLNIKFTDHLQSVLEIDAKAPFLHRVTSATVDSLSFKSAEKIGPRLHNIQRLNLFGNPDAMTPILTLLAGVPNKNKLTSLRIQLARMEHKNLEGFSLEQFIAALSGYTELRELELDLGPGILLVLMAVPSPSSLYHLSLKDVPSEDVALIASELKRFDKLGELTIAQQSRDSIIAASAIASAVPTPNALSTLSLRLRGDDRDSSDILPPAIGRFPNLRKLFLLTYSFSGAEIAKALAAIKSKEALSVLHFSGDLTCKNTLSFAEVLAAFSGLRELSIEVEREMAGFEKNLTYLEVKEILSALPNPAGISHLTVKNIRDRGISDVSSTIPAGFTTAKRLHMVRDNNFVRLFSISSSP
jgi:hypothetical protein